MQEVLLIIPSFNEEKNIGQVWNTTAPTSLRKLP